MKSSTILILFTIIFIISSCKSDKSPVQPEVKSISESVYASGIIKSNDQYEVYSKVNGILRKIFVKEGDKVKRGDPLFQLNNDNAHLFTDNARLAAVNADYRANFSKLEDVKNTISLARKKLETDSLLFLRQKKLWENNIGTKVDLEQKELNYQNSANALATSLFKYDDLQKQLKLFSDQSRNNLLISKTNEDDFLVKSETDGRVYSINKEENEMVTTQSPVAVIGSDARFLIELNIDERDIVRVTVGKQVLIIMDSYKDEVFEGVISTIDPMMNERTRTFSVKADFVKKPSILYPNLTVEANIVINSKKNVLTIPATYLVNDSMVMLEDGKLQGVKTGLMDYNLVEITSGITSNTKIILPGK